MIEPDHPRLSIVRECELASIGRSSFYREPTVESEATLRLMRLIDEQFLEGTRGRVRVRAPNLRRNGALVAISTHFWLRSPWVTTSKVRGASCSSQQPTLNQRYDATEREQMRLNATLFVNVFRIFRSALPAHNGLVAGSSCRAHHIAQPPTFDTVRQRSSKITLSL